MRIATLALLTLLIGVPTSACSAPVDAVDTVTETKTETFRGSWRDDAGVDRPATVTLVQEGTSAELTVVLEGHSCLTRSTLHIAAGLDGVKTDTEVAGMRLSIDGSPGLDDLLGNFSEIADGPCEAGWFDVHR